MNGRAPRADRSLGQHWLVDENILRVIERLAELSAGDAVLEVGAGPGILTAYLADRVRHVHAIELDRRLEAALRQRLAARANVDVVIGDAMKLDLAGLDPAPAKLVANLPYSIASPLIVESLEVLPSVQLWCVMVQREVADRLFASPSTPAYGAVSVLVQLAAERTGFHPVSPNVFRPRPRVESALVAFRRIVPQLSPGALKRTVQAGFAHRRKTLVNSLALAGVASREAAASALESLGYPPDVRAEALEPTDFVRLAGVLR